MFCATLTLCLLYPLHIFGLHCSGPSKCCRGYRWDSQIQDCIPCKYPYYGRSCIFTCNCTESRCNQFEGCIYIATPIETVTLNKGIKTQSLSLDFEKEMTTRRNPLHRTLNDRIRIFS
ncbi:uncharacterized protein LOC134257495, partial [Saccostrea cucullata]|uniref:uncharacterized protein LOC134257495 n=1 Tax=Saccostrea cuccullata TaxID=36930 RepID=UPI002ED4008F